MLRGFRENDKFFIFISESLHINFNPSPNVSLILLYIGLVMVKNEGSIACNCFKLFQIRKRRDIRTNLAYFEFCIFQTLLAKKI